jgi:hypothetical protein
VRINFKLTKWTYYPPENDEAIVIVELQRDHLDGNHLVRTSVNRVDGEWTPHDTGKLTERQARAIAEQAWAESPGWLRDRNPKSADTEHGSAFRPSS